MDLISEDLTKRTHLQHLFIKLFLKNIVLVVIDASAGSEETIFFFSNTSVEWNAAGLQKEKHHAFA